ncbi:MAG: hypothetical protein AB7O32_11350 [Vicinamibacterales bacterium]
MLERPSMQPSIGAGEELTRDHVVAHLRQWGADTHRTLEILSTLRQQVEEHTRQLENPKAAVEYLEFFSGFFTRVAEEFETLAGQVQESPAPAHADAMRQIANNAAAEQRRTVLFRDKWVNKPLPYETMRPMLTQIASEVRDQLADYRELVPAARRVAELAPPPPPPPEPKAEGFDRRALFRRIVKPLADDDPGSQGPGGNEG